MESTNLLKIQKLWLKNKYFWKIPVMKYAFRIIERNSHNAEAADFSIKAMEILQKTRLAQLPILNKKAENQLIFCCQTCS